MQEVSCGRVSPAERDEIRALFQRKLALAELFTSVAKLEAEAGAKLYEKVVADMGRTTEAFQAWWENAARRHEWKRVANGNWRINFETCEVFLQVP